MAYENWSVEWDMPVIVFDPFRRDTNSSWGSTPGAGLPWTIDGASASNYYVNSSKGFHQLDTINTNRFSFLDIGQTDFDITVEVTMPVMPASGTVNVLGIVARVLSNTEFYACDAQQAVGGAQISLYLRKGIVADLAVVPTGIAFSAGLSLTIRFKGVGPLLRGKVWRTTESQPDSWHFTVSDTTYLTQQRIGLRSILIGGGTSGSVVAQWDNLMVASDERWMNVTSYVDTARGGASGSPFEIASGDTPEASADTGGFGLPLLNADQRFTPGNTVSPYYPNIAPGSQIRVRETITDRRFDRGFGYVQYPEIQAWTQSTGTSPRDQMITIPVVDRAAWIAQGRTFISTLAEHILYHGGPALVAYWPLGDVTEGPDVNPAIGGPWTLTQTRMVVAGGNAPSTDPAAITYGGSSIAPADDLGSVTFDPAIAVDPFTEYDSSITLTGTRTIPLTLAAGQVLTLVFWARPTEIVPSSSGCLPVALRNSANSDIDASVSMSQSIIGGFGANDADWSGSVDGPPVPVDQPIPVAVRVGFNPDVIELWVRSEVYTDTMTVSSATSAEYDRMVIGDTFPGAINHLQVYLGAEDDWTNDDFVAQYQMGLTGLERQTTGERIRTVLTYAGVDPAELGRIDGGSSLMPVARMAGRSPMDLVAEAVETEQGEFWIAGDNRPTFADRIRLYNI